MSDDFPFPSLVRKLKSLVWQFQLHCSHMRFSATVKGHFTAQLITHRPMDNRTFWNHGMAQRTGAVYAPPQIYTQGTWTRTADKDTATAVATQMSTDKALTPAAPHSGVTQMAVSPHLLGLAEVGVHSCGTHTTFPSFTNTHICGFPKQWLGIKDAAGSCSSCQDPTGSRSRHQGPGVLTAPVWVQQLAPIPLMPDSPVAGTESLKHWHVWVRE